MYHVSDIACVFKHTITFEMKVEDLVLRNSYRAAEKLTF